MERILIRNSHNIRFTILYIYLISVSTTPQPAIHYCLVIHVPSLEIHTVLSMVLVSSSVSI